MQLTNSSLTSSSSSVDTNNLVIEGDACVKYDKLVIATGNAPPSIDKLESRLKGASTCTSSLCTFYTIDDCYELRRRLTYLQQTQNNHDHDDNVKNIVIVGAGYSGVELACNILSDNANKNNIMNVTLIHKGDGILSDAAEYNRMNAEKQLSKLGVHVMTNTIVSKVSNCTTDSSDADDQLVIAYPPCMVYTQSNDEEEQKQFKADLLIWTAGGGGSSDILSSLISSQQLDDNDDIISKNQKVIVDSYLNTCNDDNVYALGDISQVSAPSSNNDNSSNQNNSGPQTAQKAIQQAYIVAWNIFSQYVNANIISNINNNKNDKFMLLPPPIDIPMLPKVSFEFIELGEILTLGEKDATVSTLGGLVQINGATGSVARRLIYSLRMPTWMQALLSTVKNLNRFLLFGLLDRD